MKTKVFMPELEKIFGPGPTTAPHLMLKIRWNKILRFTWGSARLREDIYLHAN